MFRDIFALAAALLVGLITSSHARQNFSQSTLIPPPFDIQDGRPADCPPCFNCNLEAFQCAQFASCNRYNGKCSCPPGFGNEDCAQPTCGSLAQGNQRPPRGDGDCACDEGWGGINCNVCETDDACNALMPTDEGGVCYKEPRLVRRNHQICDVTNRKIVDQLKEQNPQITFSCNAEDETCNFQCKLNPLYLPDSH